MEISVYTSNIIVTAPMQYCCILHSVSYLSYVSLLYVYVIHIDYYQVMGVSVTQYALLYSLYSWPNVILSVFGGYLIDRVFGVRVGTIVFSAFVCLGQVH